jgi:hypothetical protein
MFSRNKHPKEDAADTESLRLHVLVKRIAAGSATFARFCGRWVKRLFVTPQTSAQARTADQRRQSDVRRGLRGLPPLDDRNPRA